MILPPLELQGYATFVIHENPLQHSHFLLRDAEIQRGFSMNRSRPDEITLKENIIGRAKVIDDTLVDDFGLLIYGLC